MPHPQRKRVHVVHTPGAPPPTPLPPLSFVMAKMIKEAQLLQEIADLAELVLGGRTFQDSYPRGLSLKEQLRQKLLDLRISQTG